MTTKENYFSLFVTVNDIIIPKHDKYLLVAYLEVNDKGNKEQIAISDLVKSKSCKRFSFLKQVEVDYQFEFKQNITFDLYDLKPEQSSVQIEKLGDPRHCKLLGSAGFTMAELLTAKDQVLFVDAKLETKSIGKFEIRGESSIRTSELVTMHLSISNVLEKKSSAFSMFVNPIKLSIDTFKNHYHLQISRIGPNEIRQAVWKSNVVVEESKNGELHFDTLQLSSTQLCNGDKARPLEFSLYHKSNTLTKSTRIGSFTTSLKDIAQRYAVEMPKSAPDSPVPPMLAAQQSAQSSQAISLQSSNLSIEESDSAPFVSYKFDYNEKDCKKELRLRNWRPGADPNTEPTFPEYIRGGCEIAFVVAIDFTASNRICSRPDSLHFVDPCMEQKNEYEQAIEAVGNIINAYDTDKEYPVYGFGADVKDSNGVYRKSDYFSLLPDESVLAKGIEGILQAYRDIVPKLRFSVNTDFSGVIQNTITNARPCTQEDQNYTVLLILTDGVLDEEQKTIEQIVAASHQPISIIIVGVGDNDFSVMDRLDSDNKALSTIDGSQTAERDIVQFVPFKRHPDKEDLAAAVLREIPDQLVKYMKSRNINPRYGFASEN